MKSAPIEGKQVSPDRTKIPPGFRCPPPPTGIQIMRPSLDINYMGSQCLYVAEHTMLGFLEVPVAHQHDTLSVDADNAVQHIAATFYPSHHYIADFELSRFLQDDTVTPAHNKRKHAVPIYGQRHALTVFS